MPTDPKELIASIPAVAEAVAARDDAAAAALLNAPTITIPKPNARLTELGAIDVLLVAHAMAGSNDPATAANNELIALESAATAQGDSSLLARAVRILNDVSGPGLDFGNAGTRSQIAGLQEAGVLSAVAATALLAYGSQHIGVWRNEYGHDATVDEVSRLYAQERADADNANTLEDRKQAYIAAKESKDEALIERYGRELTQTLGGEAAKETIDNG